MPVSSRQVNDLLSLLGKAVIYCHPVIVGAMEMETFDQLAFGLPETQRPPLLISFQISSVL